MTRPDLKSMKLFPRNMTAPADIVVRGNPVTSRPEDGVENCFPGLEFDQRNLDKVFCPGLTLEWHHDGGIIIREVTPDGPAARLVTERHIAEFAARDQAVAVLAFPPGARPAAGRRVT